MKVLAIVQARMGSNRLPGKVMKNLDGHPMIYHTLIKLKQAHYIDEVVLATSIKDIDTPLAEYVTGLGIPVFRGDEDNVLERYKKTADLYGGDVIIRVTGDCPLLDPIIIDHVITSYKIRQKDYIRLDVPNTFLRGFDVEVFSKEALDKAYYLIQQTNENDKYDKMYREHVTYYMYTHPEVFDIGYVKGDEEVGTDYNLSVDTLEDFERASKFIHDNGYKSIFHQVKKEWH